MERFLDGNYIQADDIRWINSIQSIQKNFDEVFIDDGFIKRFYFEGSRPVVEVNFVLNRDSLNRLLGGSFVKDEIEVTITFKNDAFSGELVTSKVVINNKTKNKRKVITYQDSTFLLTDDDGNTIKYFLQINKNDFSLKISKDDTLYSVFKGNKKEDSYQYSYQIIDKIYNLSMDIDYGDEDEYHFHSIIETENQTSDKKMLIANSFREDGIIQRNVSKAVKYTSLSVDEKKAYRMSIDNIFLPIREFINQYKDSIN